MSEMLTADSTISHYRVVSQLGAGGMGEVYLAHDTRLKRKVALKVLPADLVNNRERLHRFEQEAQAASALNHQNIITIYEIGAEGGTHFIATELIEGVTLRRRLQTARLEIEESLNTAVQIAAALDAAHRSGIVHRDVKPENVMVRGDGLVKVLDFGLAKLTEEKGGAPADSRDPTRALVKTSPGVVMGTVAYMSPEQARGQEVDARADIFSLGVVLYEMLAGRLPFAGETASDVIAAILKTEPAPLDEETPSELRRIVRKSLQKKADERYQTVRDLLIDLTAFKHEQDFAAELERSGIPTRGDHPAPTIVSDVRRATSDTRGLRKSKSRRGVVVAAAIVAVALAAAAYLYLSREKNNAAKNSIAVLPFDNAGGDPNVEYLSDGISESLINSLSQLPGVKVMARSTMFSFKGKEVNPQEVGRQLGVETVLTGRVVQRGDSLTVQTDLVNVADGSQMWGERYNRNLTDVLAVQDEIARDVLNKLRARLSPAEEQSLSRGYTQNAEAYKVYLTGRHLLNNGTPEGVRGSIQYFQQAIGLDPRFALAYAGMADAYTLMGTTVDATARPREVMPKAKEAAQKALELDSGLSEARTSLAWVKYRFDWDWRGAEDEFRRAIELNPNNAQARLWYADYLMAMGRFDEALAEIGRARELDPLSIFANWNVGRVLYHARRYDESLAEIRKTLELNENFARTHNYLEAIYLQKGMDEEALAAHLKFSALTGVSPERIAAVNSAHKSGGLKAVWRRELEWALEDSERRHVSPFIVARFYSRVADRDGALEWLNKSVEERDGTLVYLKVDQRWDFIRSDPRFQDLVHKVGLSQ